MASGLRIKWNMGTLVSISNQVNQSQCVPAAQRVASAARGSAPVDTGAYRDSIVVVTDSRTGADDWAHARVASTDPKAMVIESRTGNLARAFGAA